MPDESRTARRLLNTCAALMISAVAVGQTPAEPAPEQLLVDFIHYVKIDQQELAASFGRALLERGLEPRGFVGLVEDTPRAAQRFDEAIREALRDPALEGIAGELLTLYESGRRERARDPEEISANIDLLDGTQRGRLLGRQRLAFAGEYAAPQLLESLTDGGRRLVQVGAQELLVEMGGDSVAPLSAALLSSAPEAQEQIATILGRIGHAEALPYIVELSRTTSNQSVRTAAERAADSLAPGFWRERPTSSLYVDLAEEYYGEPVELTRFEGESHQLLWNFEPGVGLFATPVRTEVFHEAASMRLAEHALELDAETAGASSLWLAANFSREIDAPAGYDNPAYGPDRRGAMYYAVAAGPAAVEDVLSRALRDRDTPLARLAIEALAMNASSLSLTPRSAGADVAMDDAAGVVSPLIAALSYPDRRVRFEAALVAASTAPNAPFPGSDRVTPILASAIRDASARYAVVIASDLARRQELSSRLMDMGFDALPPAGTLSEALDNSAEAPGVDLVIVDLGVTDPNSIIDDARRTARLEAAPILALTTANAYNRLLDQYATDDATAALRQGVSVDEFGAAVEDLTLRASGPAVTEEQAENYALAALAALRDLAVAGSTSLKVADAVTPLISALDETDGQVRLDVAEVLSRVPEARAQQAIMEAALASDGQERIALFSKVAASAKWYGSMLDNRLVTRLYELAAEADGEEATSAAALLGALDLSQSQIAPLILDGI